METENKLSQDQKISLKQTALHFAEHLSYSTKTDDSSSISMSQRNGTVEETLAAAKQIYDWLTA